MVNKILLVAALVLFCGSASADEKLVLRSAVSPDFIDGLHAKYLNYIAENLMMDIDIKPLSFSRRLRALQKGELDILVGLQDAAEQQENLIYIDPPYQVLASTFFVRAPEKSALTNYQDLAAKRIAITAQVAYFDEFDNDDSLAKVVVDSLEQKIKLLINHRVDTFIHNYESTLVNLKLSALSDKVTPAIYQPSDKRKYYFSISRRSQLMPHLELLRRVIEQGVANGAFIEIREQHYRDLSRRAQPIDSLAIAFK
ncbi:ABC transporter substrate-binding protein [Thalassotalea euphylliae]|uniref:ABC transporter substrate-binding protein n=1 Tax=Thalassotalea euphylliae TaxID=1655234 RepID=A0A3E0TMW4_9GAMM|nr:transporter substrate-binding domain-containing protein [Thalassotalea euphylliae]REL25886.1 ABC transporter substrate-binding protein [Thalassotalea euphylliae]